jgi:hypothetical protein
LPVFRFHFVHHLARAPLLLLGEGSAGEAELDQGRDGRSMQKSTAGKCHVAPKAFDAKRLRIWQAEASML